MDSLKKFDTQIGFSKRKEWSKEDSAKMQDFIKQHNSELTPIELLENRLFAIKLEMEHYLTNTEIKEEKSVGVFIKEAINAFREFVGITQDKLAVYWGTTSANLRKYIVGTRKLNVDLAFKVASTFNYNPELLFDIERKNQLLDKSYKSYKEKYSLGKLLLA